MLQVDRETVAALVRARTYTTDGRASALRERAGLKCADLARILGVSPATVTYWEQGKRRPGGEHGVAYGHLLGHLETLLGELVAT